VCRKKVVSQASGVGLGKKEQTKMWQRFTERARRVVFFAQEEAGKLGENFVSTEHLLLGMIRENDSVACRILDRMGISLTRIRSEIERQVARGDGRLGQDMQLTPRAKRVIDLAYDEARQLNNNYIGTEHLLLGFLREGEGLAGRVLAKLGVELERTRREVLALQDSNIHYLTVGNSGDYVQEFATEFEKLPSEQRITVTGDGVPLHQLPEPMWKIMQKMLEQNVRGGSVILDPNGLVRVNVTRVEGATHYAVTSQTSFLINLLVNNETQEDDNKDG
jgi:ATP-dependent Clp protease ATP-binding subunit ClpA